MTKFPKSFSKIGRSAVTLAVLATLSIGVNIANAQTQPGVTITPPGPIGLTVFGYSGSRGVGEGYNIGGDPALGTVNTSATGGFKLTSDSYLTGNSNPLCTADCASTQAKLGIIGYQMTFAESMNQGKGTQVAPVQSIAITNNEFVASMRSSWTFTPAGTKP